jgi:hypothetical protein
MCLGYHCAFLRARLALAHLTEPEPREPHKWPQRAKEYLALAERAVGGIAKS